MKKSTCFVKRVLMPLLMILAFSLPAGAEFYKYVDENGNTIYTDDLSVVPVDQRKNIQKYEESAPTPESAETTQKAAAEPGDKAASAVEPNAERKVLLDKKNKLDAEYKALMEERKNLEKEKETAKTPGEIKTYNENVSRFNEKTKDFEERRKALEAEIESYNKMINNASGAQTDTVEPPAN